jgi:hypothetical protein
MLLEHGRMIEIGSPEKIARSYRQINFGRLVHEAPGAEADRGSRGVGEAEIVSAWFEDESGERITAASHGDPCVACFEVHFNERVVNPIFGVTIRNDTGSTVFATSTAISRLETGTFEPGETKVVRMRFENWLTASRYNLTPSIAGSGTGQDTIDVREDIATLLVHGWHFTGGVTNLPHGFEVDSR